MITIEDIIKSEEEFSINDYNGVGKDYLIIPGKKKSKVMLSAPHTVKHFRKGKMLPADTLTGSLIKNINSKINIPIIYKNRNNKDDVNFDIETEYEKALVKYIADNNIRCLIDLHTAKATRDFDFEIGDSNETTICAHEYLYPIIKANIIKHGFKLDHNVLFKASGSGTVTSEVSKKANIPCFQIEINRKNISTKDINKFNNTILMMIEIISNLEEIL